MCRILNRPLEGIAAVGFVGASKPDLCELAITSAAAVASEATFTLGFDADRTMIRSARNQQQDDPERTGFPARTER
jgi:hypothetical protein